MNMENMIAYFGFGVNNNGAKFEMRNCTSEELFNAIKAKFPKWLDSTIHTIIENKNFYNEPKVEIPIKFDKIKFPKESFMDLCKSFYCYSKNGYRQWGAIVNLLFEDGEIMRVWNHFNYLYCKVCKDNNGGTEIPISEELLQCMDKLVKVINRKAKFDIKNHIEEEWICGDKRRLGIKTLMDRTAKFIVVEAK